MRLESAQDGLEMEAQESEYSKFRRLAEYAASDILTTIQEVLNGMGDPFLFRARIDPWRIKSESSLARKAKERGWSPAKALREASDFLGLRLVCNNLQDVERVSAALTIALTIGDSRPERQDYITAPKTDGYRAIHLMFRYPIKMGSIEADFGCEIQVRSMLQDAWAQLSRVDLYTDAVPAPIMRQMRTLANQLAQADKTAENVRNRIARPRRGAKPNPKQVLTESALAFLFRQQFKKEPQDYLIRWVLREYGSLDLRSDGLDAELRDEAFQGRLCAAYESKTRWNAEPEQMFRWSVHALAYGREAAVRLAARNGREEWREVDLVARGETLSSLPDDADSLASSFQRITKDDEPESEIEQASLALGAKRSCSCCGTLIVDPEALAKATVSHYKLRGKRAEKFREEIEDTVRSSGVEIGSWDNPSLCGYCDYRMSKDD